MSATSDEGSRALRMPSGTPCEEFTAIGNCSRHSHAAYANGLSSSHNISYVKLMMEVCGRQLASLLFAQMRFAQ